MAITNRQRDGLYDPRGMHTPSDRTAIRGQRLRTEQDAIDYASHLEREVEELRKSLDLAHRSYNPSVMSISNIEEAMTRQLAKKPSQPSQLLTLPRKLTLLLG